MKATTNNYQPYCGEVDISEVSTSVRALVSSHYPNSLLRQILSGSSDDEDIVDPPAQSIPTISQLADTSTFTKFLECACSTFTPKICSEISSFDQLSPEWHLHRVGRLTASLFGTVSRYRGSNPLYIVAKVFGKPLPDIPALAYGREREPVARALYIASMRHHKGMKVSEIGLVVKPGWPHLGASPDGLVTCACCGQGCLEIKCVASRSERLPIEVAKDPTYKHVSCSDNNELILNPSSYWYDQVQGTDGSMWTTMVRLCLIYKQGDYGVSC